MKLHFDFYAPTQVRFGIGRRSEIPNLLRGRRWALVSTERMLSRPPVAGVVAECRAAGVELVTVGSVSPNPRLREVQEALEAACRAEVSGVIAVGGGSVMDAAKLLTVAYRHGADARRVLFAFEGVADTPTRRDCRLVAVPTTAGTGAEVSRGAVITDEGTGRKVAARGRELVPDEAVIDPELTLSLPPRRTAETGFDIIAHAVETYLSRAATPLTDVLALAALEVVPAALARAVDNGGDVEARTSLSLHSWLMGYNLAHASTCLPHRMQYAVGAMTDTSHQIGLAALYPAWVTAVREHAGGRMEEVTRRLRAFLVRDAGFRGDVVPIGTVFGALLDRLGINVTLGDLGVSSADIETLTDAVEGRIDLDPMGPSRDDVRRLFAQSLGA